jgi:hypothetical protein
MHAEAAGRVGILLLGMLHMVNTKCSSNEPRAEGLRQIVAATICLMDMNKRLKQQATSYKLQATSYKLQAIINNS